MLYLRHVEYSQVGRKIWKTVVLPLLSTLDYISGFKKWLKEHIGHLDNFAFTALKLIDACFGKSTGIQATKFTSNKFTKQK